MPDTATTPSAPTRKIRLFLDEDVWPGLAAILREHSFDVVHACEVQRGGMPDADQLAYAAEIGCIILTHNAKDFAPLAAEYYFGRRSHAGIILSPQLQRGELVRRMLSLLHSLSAEEMVNTVRFLSDYS